MGKNLLFAALIACVGGCTGLEGEDIASSTHASHSWGGYHWARSSSSFQLITINSLTSDWDPYLRGALADWSSAQEVDFVEVAGDESSQTRRKCSAPDGMVRVCNLAYGNNGWLGIAGISLDADGHIVRGYTKLNDTYFSSSYYNDDTWKQSVTCQELGHDIGLDHQDEDFNNETLKTCMDYQDPPWPSPNSHDYEQLGLIYDHVDSYDSYATSGGGDGGGGDGGGNGCNAPPGKGCNKANAAWGASLGRHGQVETFSRHNPDGTIEITKVTWAHGF